MGGEEGGAIRHRRETPGTRNIRGFRAGRARGSSRGAPACSQNPRTRALAIPGSTGGERERDAPGAPEARALARDECDGGGCKGMYDTKYRPVERVETRSRVPSVTC